jgi:hypothetical protein
MPKYLRHLLDDCFGRVARASEHLADLENRIDGAIRAQVDDLAIEHDVNPARFPAQYQVSQVTRGNETHWCLLIPILTGEIIYNLRSALDYLVFKLAQLDSGVEQEGTQFPIVDAQKDWPSNVGRLLKGVNNAHVVAIERLQPYNGCDWSRRLRDLSNPDKHRHLIVTGGNGDFFVHSSLVTNLSGCLGYEREAPHPVPGQALVKVKVDFRGKVTFRDGSPIVGTIKQIEAGVANTLATFKPEF